MRNCFVKKNIVYKKILAVAFMLGCLVQFSGCGSREKEDSDDSKKGTEVQSGQEEQVPVYAVSYQETDMEGNLVCSQTVGDTVYVFISKKAKAAGKYEQHVYSLKLGENTSVLLPVTFGENTYVNHMCLDSEGNLFIIQNRIEDEARYSDTCYLTGYTQKGEQFLQVELTEFGEPGEYLFVQYVAVDKEGNIYVSGIKGEDNSNMVWILDKEGKQIGEFRCDNWIYALFTLPNGKTAAVMTDRGGSLAIQEIDADKKSFGKSYQNLPDADSHFASVSKETMLMTGDRGAYLYNITSETYETVVDWADCDMDNDDVRGFGMLEDGRLWTLSQKGVDGTEVKVAYLSEKDTSETAEKVTIVVGTLYYDQDKQLWQQVNAFNRTNDTYRIEVRNYLDGDEMTGKLRLDTDLISGNGPDVIYLNGSMLNSSSNVSPHVYMSRGIFEDLNPYLDGDETCRREDYLENVLAAYEMEGKLYGIAPFFQVATVVGSAADVGEEPGWTIDEAMALMDSKPEETEFFAYMSKDWLLYQLCNTYMNRLIDWSTGECKFDDGYFEQILEFTNRFPAENFRMAGDEEISEKIRNGKLLLVPLDFCAVPDYMMYHILFDGPITFIGYPTEEGTGSYIRPEAFVGMTAGSENKEGAWEFVKLFLLEEYQNTDSTMIGFPVLKSALEKQFEWAMTPVYAEENGEMTEQTKYYYQGLQFGAATKEDVSAVMALIESAHGVTEENIEITGIIREEAGAYFEGQKSIKETVDIIQSRVQIYVNENR